MKLGPGCAGVVERYLDLNRNLPPPPRTRITVDAVIISRTEPREPQKMGGAHLDETQRANLVRLSMRVPPHLLARY